MANQYNAVRVETKCNYCPKIFLELPSRLKRGNGKFCSKDCDSLNKQIKYLDKSNPYYKHGQTPKTHKIRTSQPYETMRIEVLKRDDNKCTDCGKQGRLEVHHIKPIKVLLEEFEKLGIEFNRNNEHFHDINNLITLCPRCHRLKEKV